MLHTPRCITYHGASPTTDTLSTVVGDAHAYDASPTTVDCMWHYIAVSPIHQPSFTPTQFSKCPLPDTVLTIPFTPTQSLKCPLHRHSPQNTLYTVSSNCPLHRHSHSMSILSLSLSLSLALHTDTCSLRIPLFPPPGHRGGHAYVSLYSRPSTPALPYLSLSALHLPSPL